MSKTHAAAIGDALSRPASPPSVSRISRRLMRWSEPRSGKATNSVSSPAIEPATSGQRARSSAAAIACADPGSVRTHEQQAGLVDLDRQVGQELAQAVLARRLGLDQARRERVGGGALAGDLDQAQFGDVARDRRLGRPEAALAEGGRQLLLGPDRALLARGPGSPAGGAAS